MRFSNWDQDKCVISCRSHIPAARTSPQLISILLLRRTPEARSKNSKFCEDKIAYFPLIRRVPRRKRRLQKFSVATGKSLPNNDRGIHRQTHRHMRRTILVFSHVFFAAGTCLPSRCPAMKESIPFTELLSNNGMKDTHADTQTDERDLWSTPLREVQVPCAYQLS
jgi:hypothetical protein